jgi:LytS/YehU family sensor histidine kinase
MQYAENPILLDKYLVWIAIFLMSWGFIYLIQFLQRKRMEQNWETEKQLTELQFSSIRSQLNPHFIFNALNSIGYLIENGKKDEAYDFLSVQSRMIRHILEDAEMTTQSLDKEIEFVRDYLSVQKFRFGDKLEYTIDVDPEIELTLVVPKMIIHTYVENAVKHGLRNHKGKIGIKCKKIPHGVKLTISDNGIGITHSENSPQNTGKGLSIMDKYYRLFEKEFNCKIHTTIEEINKPGLSGTEVVITIKYLS